MNRAMNLLVTGIVVAGALVTVRADDFLRGDVNTDGTLSVADMIQLERALFESAGLPTCLDAADVNDDGVVNISDSVNLLIMFFHSSFGQTPIPFVTPPEPFPAPGGDPTNDDLLDCERYEVIPPMSTDDTIRLGDVDAAPGEVVEIPIYIRASVPVSGLQLVVEYDPTVLQIESGMESLDFAGSWFEQYFGKTFTIVYRDGHGTSTFVYSDTGPMFNALSSFPSEGFFTVGVVGHIAFPSEFAIESSDAEVLVGSIRALVSGDATPGTKITVTPKDGPDGDGFGSFGLRNELTYQGESRLATILPATNPGVLNVAVDGDISFFVRGDSNRDDAVNIADPLRTLMFLFAEGETVELACPDAADANDSGGIDVSDALYTLNFLFTNGPTLPAPYPAKGRDPRPDFLPPCGAVSR